MRNRFRIVIAILFLALVGGLTWKASIPSEPVYEGKTLSEWLEACDQSNRTVSQDEFQKAYKVVRQTGTNAVPTLIRMWHAHDSALKIKLLSFLQKQRFVKLANMSAFHRHELAMTGFWILGKHASNAIPDLTTTCEKAPPLEQHIETIVLFGHMGPAASDSVSFLIHCNSDTNYFVRLDSVSALADIHARPELSIPAFIKCLHSPEPNIRGEAARGLAAFGSLSSNAVPHLLPLLTNYDGLQARSAAIKSLQTIDPEAAAKAGVK